MSIRTTSPKSGWVNGCSNDAYAIRWCESDRNYVDEPELTVARVATKYTTGYRFHQRNVEATQSTFVGNSVKSMKLSVEASLEKPRTDYLDILYVH
jgi:predicted aldo/keto reductase-like oxidoreductase